MNHNLRRQVLALISLLILLSILVPGCTPQSGLTSVTTYAPVGNILLLSPVPKLGETSELTYTLNFRDEAIKLYGLETGQSKAWIDFEWTDIHGSYSAAKHTVPIPLSEVLVSGDISWEGNALENRNAKVINCTIKLPREGIWKINMHFQTPCCENNQPGGGPIWIAVADGDAGILNRTGFSSGPLGYLGYFPYGIWTDRVLNESSYPILVVLDISKAPRAGEEATLTCRITSLYDVADFPTKITFTTWEKGAQGTDIPSTDLLVKGDLQWRGSLKPGEPVEFSSTIKFPREGDWQILASGTNLSTGIHCSDIIEMNITPDRGSFGWKPYTISYTTISPLPVSGSSK